jgi:hypothetical protein
MVATVAEAKETRLVTREEIMDAFRFFDGMEIRADHFNLRYQILIDMLFETNPESLRAKLQQLVDLRKGSLVLVDANSGQVAPFDPDMYDELGHKNAQMEQLGRERIDAALAPVQEQLQQSVTGPKIKEKLKRRIARAVRKRVIGV